MVALACHSQPIVIPAQGGDGGGGPRATESLPRAPVQPLLRGSRARSGGWASEHQDTGRELVPPQQRLSSGSVRAPRPRPLPPPPAPGLTRERGSVLRQLSAVLLLLRRSPQVPSRNLQTPSPQVNDVLSREVLGQSTPSGGAALGSQDSAAL